MNEHWIVCTRERPSGVLRWACVSYWAYNAPGQRTLVERQRSTVYYNLKAAQRWARKYNVPCPTDEWTNVHVDTTCGCGLYVHPNSPHRNPDAIHIDDCPYRPN